MIAGLAYLYNCFAAVIAPTFEALFCPQIITWPGIAGEDSLILRISIMGVNSGKWKQQASVAGMHA